MTILTKEDGTVLETTEEIGLMDLLYNRHGLNIKSPEGMIITNDDVDKLIDFCQKSKKLFEGNNG
jgi:hypothetical protein